MSFQPINPKPYLNSLIGLKVVVKLKFSGTEYHDKDVIELEPKAAGEEVDLGEGTHLDNELFIRCNNVLWIGKEVEQFS
ncbi:hypothetical protein C6P40_001648 [Pichia californica]|uniref:LSM domain-containing protein n=1 Tax=Pichia californica TaxID=460514 RepID=A0A9P6WQH1_9ASCO|nr:hypothetical protein C6P40_001648 [[Candida] californica]